jgi:putative membrane protein
MKINQSSKKVSLALVLSGITCLTFAQDSKLTTPALPEHMVNQLTAQQFVTDAAVGGIKEIKLSQIALKQTQNAEVKKFANQMIQDHTAANARLEQIARAEGLNFPAANTFTAGDPNWHNSIITGSQPGNQTYQLTTNMPVAAYQDIKQLSGLSGPEFDEAYAKDMVSDHATAVHEFEVAGRDLFDVQLREFASSTLPTLRMHSEMAQQLANDLNGTETASR